MTIAVLCDRCRTAGTAGSGDFSHLGDLLDFAPVPMRPRVNGWDAEAQRAFIALLATTGSKRRAALAIGRNAHGIDQILKRPDSAGFKAAYDRALAIARTDGAVKLATGVADAAARNAHHTPPSRLRGHEPDPADDDAMDDDAKIALLENIFRKHLLKVQLERTDRLAGNIVSADFTLRQITVLEVALELLAEDLGLDVWQTLIGLRRGGQNIIAIAETPVSRELDARRRELWARMADPERPEHPPLEHLKVFATHSVEPLQSFGPASDPPAGIDPEAWSAMKHDEQKQVLAELHRQAAEEQIAYESRAQRAWESGAQSSRRPDED